MLWRRRLLLLQRWQHLHLRRCCRRHRCHLRGHLPVHCRSLLRCCRCPRPSLRSRLRTRRRLPNRCRHFPRRR